MFTPKRTAIAKIGDTSLELPNFSKGKAPESNKDLVNKKYVDDQFPVTHASTTGQTGDDHHVEFTTTEHSAIGDNAPHHTKAVSGDIDHDATINTHNLTTDISHDSIADVSADDHHAETHTIVSHDTTGTGAELDTLTDNSMADTLHRHSELSASDGSPDAVLGLDVAGNAIINNSIAFGSRLADTTPVNLFMISGANDLAIGSGVIGNTVITTGTSFGVSVGGVPIAFIVQTGTGNVGIGSPAPTLPLDVKAKSGMSAIGGFCIKLTNKTGGNTVAGQVVCIYTATAIDDAFRTCSLGDLNPIGIVLDAGVADGSEAWIVVAGIADVLMEDGGSARGDRLITSANVGGRAEVNNSPSTAVHFQEIGHCMETRVGAGLARAVVHFL